MNKFNTIYKKLMESNSFVKDHLEEFNASLTLSNNKLSISIENEKTTHTTVNLSEDVYEEILKHFVNLFNLDKSTKDLTIDATFFDHHVSIEIDTEKLEYDDIRSANSYVMVSVNDSKEKQITTQNFFDPFNLASAKAFDESLMSYFKILKKQSKYE